VKETKYEIGNRIRKYREECNMTQKQLAERIGVSNSRVSNWEQGLNRPDADILAAVCVALDVSPSLLLGIRVTGDDLTEQERRVLKAYREKDDVRQAVHILLGISENAQE
jgi:transcriptional regulator with XRE-family HTH domain